MTLLHQTDSGGTPVANSPQGIQHIAVGPTLPTPTANQQAQPACKQPSQGVTSSNSRVCWHGCTTQHAATAQHSAGFIYPGAFGLVVGHACGHVCVCVFAVLPQVLLAGEFQGEDLPLYDIEIKYKGGLKNAILHPNRPGAAHKLEEGQVGEGSTKP